MSRIALEASPFDSSKVSCARWERASACCIRRETTGGLPSTVPNGRREVGKSSDATTGGHTDSMFENVFSPYCFSPRNSFAFALVSLADAARASSCCRFLPPPPAPSSTSRAVVRDGERGVILFDGETLARKAGLSHSISSFNRLSDKDFSLRGVVSIFAKAAVVVGDGIRILRGGSNDDENDRDGDSDDDDDDDFKAKFCRRCFSRLSTEGAGTAAGASFTS